MMVERYFHPMKRLGWITLILAGFSCVKVSPVEEPYPLGAAEFSYLQAANKLFVSVSAASSYKGNALDSVMVLWQGIDSTATADTLTLNDKGLTGDIISGDNVHSLKIANSSSSINNILPSSAKDSVYLSVLARYSGTIFEDKSAFLLGNIRPRISSVWTPDTVARPTVNEDPNVTNTVKFPVTCVVYDANGLEDIRKVQFRSFHTQLDSFMNGGNPILLYDDGTGTSGSGDLQKGDGTYTITANLTETATTGTYQWIFEAQDFSNAYSDTSVRVIVVK